MMHCDFDNGCYGYCAQCGTTHRLGIGQSMDYAQNLMDEMVHKQRLDIDVPKEEADPKLELAKLFPGDRGHMFGVLEAEDQDGQTIWLKAFSSLRGGIRFVPGWVPPNLSAHDYDTVVTPQENAIKSVSAQWAVKTCPDERARLSKKRAQMSQNLWQEMLSLYTFHNFKGQAVGVQELFQGRGIPGGTGECCAPKLLCEAAKRGLRPKGLCEFYWGPKTTYEGKSEGQFYPCCEPRCRPILGFILCGIEPC